MPFQEQSLEAPSDREEPGVGAQPLAGRDGAQTPAAFALVASGLPGARCDWNSAGPELRLAGVSIYPFG